MSALDELIKRQSELDALTDVYIVGGNLSQRATNELAAIRAERDEAVRLLKDLEWAGQDEWGLYCPKCVAYLDMGGKHEDDCELFAFINGKDSE